MTTLVKELRVNRAFDNLNVYFNMHYNLFKRQKYYLLLQVHCELSRKIN